VDILGNRFLIEIKGDRLREFQGKNDPYKLKNMAASLARRHILGFNYFL
jgi:hypothetical protein